MKVLMFGWEFPPFKTGGLGTACYGLTRGLKHMGVDVTFVIPKAGDMKAAEYVKIVGALESHTPHEKIENPVHFELSETLDGMEDADAYGNGACQEEAEDYSHVRLVHAGVHLSPYSRPIQYYEVQEKYEHTARNIPSDDVPESSDVGEMNTSPPNTPQNEDLYGNDLFRGVQDYADKAKTIAAREEFDVIHAHDWMTFKAGMEAKQVSGKPLVIHVHSTEYDRTGGLGHNPAIYDIEQTGAHQADRIIAVSNKTKKTIVKNYGIPANKVSVVYNAIDIAEPDDNAVPRSGLKNMVLFLGRITVQKGPDYFLEAAARVLEKEPDTIFVMAGNGDMMHRMIERSADLGIGHKVLFPGFLKGPAVDTMYEMADLYVMPSVSEPFGIAPLEAMSHGLPVIISRQSGVSEVIRNALKIDFWDVDALTKRIVALLRHKRLRSIMGKNGRSEVESLSWNDSAAQCVGIYKASLKKAQMPRALAT